MHIALWPHNQVIWGIGSTAPGLLTFFIDKFSLVFPDYRERVIKHGSGVTRFESASEVFLRPSSVILQG